MTMGDILFEKVAVVTGSGRGIGRAHALAMAEQGAKVVVNDPGAARDGRGFDPSPADEVVAEIRAKGGEAVANHDSVADPEGAANIIKTAVDNFGRLDALVNNAGMLREKMSWNMTDDDWDAVIKVHLYGHFYCAREAIKVFRKQQTGRIINTSSSAGLGGTGQINYVAAKEGIVGLTRGLAQEVWKYGITVNCLRPGAATRMTQSPEMMESYRKRFGREEAERRISEREQAVPPEGCSSLVVFLASDAAENVNGCVFDVRMGSVGIYRDPPYVEGTLHKDGNWTPEELVELLPKTLTEGKTAEPLDRSGA